MVFALSPAVLISAFPPEEWGRALGLQATLTYLGMSIGPGLGGWLTQHLGWSSIFLVNVPVGAVMWCVSLRVLPRDPARERRELPPFDTLGAILLATGLTGLLLGASEGPTTGWFHPVTAASLVAGGLATIAFLAVERRREYPVLDLTLFQNRVFAASTLAAFLAYAATAAVNFTSPFFLMRGGGLTESQAGLLLMALPCGMLLLTAAAGRLSDRIGPRIPSTLGMAFLTAGGLALAGATPVRGAAAFLPGALAIGLGNGLFTAPNNSAIMGAAPGARRGVAGAVLAAARTTGFAAGTALAAILFAVRLRAFPAPTPPAVAAGAHTCYLAVGVLGIFAAVLCALRGR